MKTILFINPGPTYYPHSESYQASFKKLSANYGGYIFTTSQKNEHFDIDKFKYISMRSKNKSIDTIRFFIFCLWHSINIVLKGKKIDLVTTYDPLKTGIIGLILAAILRAKFAPEVNGVYTSPAVWIDEPNGIKKMLQKYLYPLIMQFVLGRADGIRLLFKEQIDPFKDIIQGKVIHHFSLFVQEGPFKNIREDKEILFVGFPFKLKGVDVLIDAFKQIAHRYPEWKLKILGWYPKPDELYKAIDGHPQIYHHPPVKHDQMIEHMGTCAIFVLPSRSEAMGRVLLEAMAAEKPRIGSKVDGIPTVINDGFDGLLVRPGDVNDLAEKLDMLMGDPELRKRLGAAAKERVSREFTQEIYFQNLNKFYKEILEI